MVCWDKFLISWILDPSCHLQFLAGIFHITHSVRKPLNIPLLSPGGLGSLRRGDRGGPEGELRQGDGRRSRSRGWHCSGHGCGSGRGRGQCRGHRQVDTRTLAVILTKRRNWISFLQKCKEHFPLVKGLEAMRAPPPFWRPIWLFFFTFSRKKKFFTKDPKPDGFP